MFNVTTSMGAGEVSVVTSDNGGLETDQIVELAMDKLLKVSETAPPAIRDQAEVFREQLRALLAYYINIARREERATICHILSREGQDVLADAIRRM